MWDAWREIIGGDGAEEPPRTGPQPFAGGDSALPGSAAGWECPDSVLSSAARRFSSITVFCSKQIIQKAAVSCFALGHGAETLTHCSSAASLPQLHPSVPRPGQAGGLGSPRLLVALLTPHQHKRGQELLWEAGCTSLSLCGRTAMPRHGLGAVAVWDQRH